MWECRSAWGQEMGEKPSRGLSCFNSLDPQSRESTGSPERTSGGSNWQGLKASSETDLMDEGALERNGVLLSTEKYRGGHSRSRCSQLHSPRLCLFYSGSLVLGTG